MSAGNGKRCFGGAIVSGGEETFDPGNRTHTFNAQDSAVAGAEHFGFVVAQNGSLAEEKRGRRRAYLFDCAHRLRSD